MSTLINGMALKLSSLSMRIHDNLSQDNTNSAGSRVYLSLNKFPIDISLVFMNAAQSYPLTICIFKIELINSDAKIPHSDCI